MIISSIAVAEIRNSKTLISCALLLVLVNIIVNVIWQLTEN